MFTRHIQLDIIGRNHNYTAIAAVGNTETVTPQSVTAPFIQLRAACYRNRLSVILQRCYYKMGKRKGVKQRLFKRAPIHDHFRTSLDMVEAGCTVKFTQPRQLFHESKITVRFWIVTIVLAAITIITLKIR